MSDRKMVRLNQEYHEQLKRMAQGMVPRQTVQGLVDLALDRMIRDLDQGQAVELRMREVQKVS